MRLDTNRLNELYDLPESQVLTLLAVNEKCKAAIESCASLAEYAEWREENDFAPVSSRRTLSDCLAITTTAINHLMYVVNNPLKGESVGTPLVKAESVLNFRCNPGHISVTLRYKREVYSNSKPLEQTLFQGLIDIYRQLEAECLEIPIELAKAIIQFKDTSAVPEFKPRPVSRPEPVTNKPHILRREISTMLVYK